MTRQSFAVVVALAVLPVWATAARSAEPKEPLVEQVRKAIDNGVRFLKQKQTAQGHWEIDPESGGTRHGGWTCLALLALLDAGVKPAGPVIQKGLEDLRGNVPPQHHSNAAPPHLG